MHYIVLFMMLAVTVASYLVDQHVAPSPTKFIPEMLSGVIAVYVVLAGIKNKFAHVRTQYWLFFGGAAIVILCGILANAVAPGPIIAGLRMFFRALPFFFLPAVYPFKEWQIRQQLTFLAAIALLQLPLAVFQKYSLLREGRFTGDYVFGTLMLSPTLTIFLIGAVSILLALKLRGRVSTPLFATFFVLFLIPTTINETKITVFLFPMIVIVTMMLATSRGKRLKIFAGSLSLLVVAAVIFIPIFNYLAKQNVKTKDAESITTMFTKEGYMEKYLNRETKVGDTKEIGRVDSFTVPFSVISGDPVTFAFGVGMGNASISSLGTQFSGYHSATLGRYATGGSSAGSMLLEIGVLGFICAFSLHWLVIRDSTKLARTNDDLISVIAIGWPAVVAMYTLTFFYTAPIPSESLSYLFWYFSGLIAARRMKLTHEPNQLREQRTAYLRPSLGRP